MLDAVAFHGDQRMNRRNGRDVRGRPARGKRRSGGPIPGEVNAWETIRLEIPAIFSRAYPVEFNCMHAFDAIISRDSHETFPLSRPALLKETRNSKKLYRHEVETNPERRRGFPTGKLLPSHQVVASQGDDLGLPSGLYLDMLHDWRLVTVNMPNHMGQGRKNRDPPSCST